MSDTGHLTALQAAAPSDQQSPADEIPSASPGGRVGKNFVYLLLSQLATWSVTLVVLVRVPASLGTADYGKFGFSLAYVQFFTLIASLGTALLLTRTIARQPGVLASYVYNALILKLVLTTVLTGAALGLAWALGKSGEVLVLVGLACVGMVIGIINEVFIGALSGLERMGRYAMWAVVQVYVASGVGLLVLALGGGVVAYAAAYSLAIIVPAIANGRTVWPYLRGATHLDMRIWRALVRGGAPLMVLVGLNLVYGSIDVPILDSIAGETTVGWYTLAYRWVLIPIFIATAALSAYFPSFSAQGTIVSEEFARLVNQALRLVVTVSVPASLGLAVVAGDIRQLFYSTDYQPFVPILQILALHIPLVTVGMVLGMALVASDRQSKYIIVAACAAVLNPLVGVLAIRAAVDAFDNGAIGAAIVTVGTEMFVLGGAVMVRSSGVMDRRVTFLCARVVLAGLAMAGAVALVDAPILVRVPVGMVVYGVASLALRTVTVAEVRRGLDVVRGALLSLRRPPRGAPTAV